MGLQKDQEETKELFDSENQALRERIAELEAADAERLRVIEDLSEKYRSVLADIGDGYFEIDLECNLTFCNGAFEQITGRVCQGLHGSNFRQYVSEEDARKLLSIFNQIYLTEAPAKEVEHEIIRPDGGRRFISTSASLIKS